MSDARAPDPLPLRKRLFANLESREETFVGGALRTETVGGALLLLATVIAVGWANSPWSGAYQAVLHQSLGPLDVQHWAADGALTVFFYVAGLELKRELVVGSLSRLADAMVPVVAAVAGMVAPALIYVVVNLPAGGELSGWAVPMATDIAFALAVLAVVGRHLPSSLRAFLLTLAVVDDLGAITVIALFFSNNLDFVAFAAALVAIAAYGTLQHRRVTSPLLYVPLVIGAWWFMYQSGVHATIAGVVLGLLTRVRPDADEDRSPAERLEHRLRPLSAGFCVPGFALFAAGVPLELSSQLVTDPVVLGIAIGLVAGKGIGVTGGAYVAARFTRAELAPDLGWRDVGAVGVLAGIGFTVSLLIADLAFAPHLTELAKTAVLLASVLAAVLAAVLLRRRSRTHAAVRTSRPA